MITRAVGMMQNFTCTNTIKTHCKPAPIINLNCEHLNLQQTPKIIQMVVHSKSSPKAL